MAYNLSLKGVLVFTRLILLLFLSGCPFVFAPPDLENTARDDDGDGYDESNGDCDDSSGEVYPGAPELCDGLLNNCSSDSIPAEEVDNDGDGYVECEIDARGWAGPTIVGGNDCDDTNDVIGQNTHPAAAINNSQGCLKDVDGDDYGDDSPSRPDVEAGTDCDDDHNNIHPGLAEAAVDGLDNDCSGDIDRIFLENAQAKFSGEEADDNAGNDVSAVGDIDGDGYADLAIAAVQAGGGAGAVYVAYGSAAGPSSMGLGSAATKLTGLSGDYAGWSVSGVGDVNQDGNDDLLIGAALLDDDWTGAAYLILGSPKGIASMSLDDAQAEFLGENEYDDLGNGLSGAGDHNGDGYDDFVLGAPGANMAYLILGSDDVSTIDLADADGKIDGEDVDIGDSLSDGGDVNGDGYADLLVGSSDQTVGLSHCGAVYLMLGSTTISHRTLSDADTRIAGEHKWDKAGTSLANAGDINGDGYDDLLIGAPGDLLSTTNGVYWVLGSAAGLPDMRLTDADGKALGETEGDGAGWSVSGAGDVNGDGFDDIVVGAPFDSTVAYDAGAAYLILGLSSGVLDIGLDEADAKMFGETDGDWAGWAVAGVGDTNGDGFDDLLLGAKKESSTSEDGGAAYLVLGEGF